MNQARDTIGPSLKLTQPLNDWTPIRIRAAANQPIVEWCHFGTLRFTEPFFEDSVAAALRQPSASEFRRTTPIDVFNDFPERYPSVPPAGSVFHMSRCGSTLVAQMLAACPRNIVIAEAPPIDWVLRARERDPDMSTARQIAWLRGLIRAYGQPRGSSAAYLFVKFDSWHVLDLPLIHEAFPNVPWIFLYREPVEVLLSHQRQRGMQMVPGLLDPRVFGLPTTAAYPSLDQFCATVLAKVCAAALSHASLGRSRLVNFAQLPGTLEELAHRWFGIDYAEEEMALMLAAAKFHAKRRTQPYLADSAEKQRAAGTALHALAAHRLRPLYERLETVRTIQNGPPTQPAVP